MKTSRLRRFSICLNDLEAIPVEKITVAGNGKKYVSISTWDYQDGHTNDHDFSISVTRSPQEIKDKSAIQYIGGGLIIENY
ncbi:hypothetical protein [Flavobacterium sp. 5]|uniref:hypothetical protein n=1 Tax=Flavobacterium sp. 5 TaxID=2035199 RepID=UPI000C2B80DD|nr:hypothetical protein [Flavobacterium sp. 5]PKB18364.1 hypothetical protein CLU82_3639 [Flavobacterium sp. 5]